MVPEYLPCSYIQRFQNIIISCLNSYCLAAKTELTQSVTKAFETRVAKHHENFVWEIIHLGYRTQKIWNMHVRSKSGNRKFHVKFWSMFFLALKFKLNAVANFRNRILFSIASKSWSRMERGILVPTYGFFHKDFSKFWVLKVIDFIII